MERLSHAPLKVAVYRVVLWLLLRFIWRSSRDLICQNNLVLYVGGNRLNREEVNIGHMSRNLAGHGQGSTTAGCCPVYFCLFFSNYHTPTSLPPSLCFSLFQPLLGPKIRKLRDCAPMEGEFYPDEEPAKALAAISVALKPWSSASR